MTNCNDGDWQGWNGGECPVHPKTVVDAVWCYAAGDVTKHRSELAGHLQWQETSHGKIIAFRVVKEGREPREWWIGSDGCAYGDEELAPRPRIHVVEKLK